MKKSYKKAVYLIIFILITLSVICLVIPLVHDFLFDRFSISNYEEKEGLVTDVTLEDKDDMTCEYIVVDDYDIFVQCGSEYEQQFKIGDETTYYVYKDKAYHTEAQMKSGSFVGKILDYGMIGTYIVLFFLIMGNRKRLSDYIDDMSGNKESL